MKEISKQDIETLLRLQEAETRIVQLEDSLLKDQQREAEFLARQEQFQKGIDEQKKNLAVCTASCEEVEQDIRLIDQRITKSNETLRMVRSNKEYQALLREVEENRRRKEGIETSLLELMEEKDQLSAAIDQAEKEFAQLQSQGRAEQEEIHAQVDRSRGLLEDYRAEQKQMGEQLDPALMSLFKRIAKMNKGLAVAKVQDSVCMGCFMNVPPQMYIEVQRGKDLISCPQCSRILYYDEVNQEL